MIGFDLSFTTNLLYLFISSVCILIWGIFRKWPNPQIFDRLVTWMIAWLAYSPLFIWNLDLKTRAFIVKFSYYASININYWNNFQNT